jgi:hypothetical protein
MYYVLHCLCRNYSCYVTKRLHFYYTDSEIDLMVSVFHILTHQENQT